jgi:uncharacterized protein (DUF1810 family)
MVVPDADLERFHNGYRRHLNQALGEINDGRKRSHWMWFIFPQVAGLGSSPTAAHHAIRGAEAEAFRRDPILGPGYRTLVDAARRDRSWAAASPSARCSVRPDDHKLISSLTDFAGVASRLGDEWTKTIAQANEIPDQA